jgi:hypothetical protein
MAGQLPPGHPPSRAPEGDAVRVGPDVRERVEAR